MKKEAISVDPLLLDDAFWIEAVDPSTAFALEARTEFRRGLIHASVDELAWARLVLPAITDRGLMPVAARLLELAAGAPDAEFVEPVTLFMMDPKVINRLRVQLQSMSADQRDTILKHATQLLSAMQGNRDTWAEKFAESLRLLQEAPER